MFKKIIAILLALFPLSVNAANLYLDPANGTYGPGSVFGVYIKLDSDKGECINAAEVNVNFDKKLFQFEDFSAGESFLTLWISRPDKSSADGINDSGKLSFSGGVPGGYCGKVPGDPGDSNILGKIFFRVPGNENISVDAKGMIAFADGSKLLLNDGFGTAAKLTTTGGEYIVSGKISGNVNEWDNILKSDKTPPEPFVVELNKDDSVFGGKYFIIFSTTDKQSGIDHYEVMETKLADLAKETQSGSWLERLFRKARRQNWKIAVSPFALSDQTLMSQIKVKAVDKAGNERIVEFTPTEEQRPYTIAGNRSNNLFAYWIIGIILVVIIAFIIKKRRQKT